MFEQLNSRFVRIVKNIKGQGKITDDNIGEALRDIRRALLEADVNFQVAKSFINRVKDKAEGAPITNGDPRRWWLNANDAALRRINFRLPHHF